MVQELESSWEQGVTTGKAGVIACLSVSNSRSLSLGRFKQKERESGARVLGGEMWRQLSRELSAACLHPTTTTMAHLYVRAVRPQLASRAFSLCSRVLLTQLCKRA